MRAKNKEQRVKTCPCSLLFAPFSFIGSKEREAVSLSLRYVEAISCKFIRDYLGVGRLREARKDRFKYHDGSRNDMHLVELLFVEIRSLASLRDDGAGLGEYRFLLAARTKYMISVRQARRNIVRFYVIVTKSSASQ